MKFRWKGSLGKLISDNNWRRLIDLTERQRNTENRSLREIKSEQKQLLLTVLLKCIGNTWQDEENICLTVEQSAIVRAELARSRIVTSKLESSELITGADAGWVAASSKVVGRRRDLLDAFGVRFYETTHHGLSTLSGQAPFDKPIDVVYTWVDGADPAWIAQRNEYMSYSSNVKLKTSDNYARFISNDELKYSLRSVDAFMPWVNHIYVVTSGQVPEWLDMNNNRISIVAHNEIFNNQQCLPTFNSHAIESQIHHIPGLAENFLYMNDDFFIGKTLKKEVFYTNDGSTRFVLSERSYEDDLSSGLPINIAAANNNDLLFEKFGMRARLKFKHVAHPQKRSILDRIELEHSEQVAQTAAARFRSATDLSIPSALAHYYGLALGTAISTEASYKYIDMGSADAQLKLAKFLWSPRPQMFCLNQVSGDEEELARQNKAMTHFLRIAFPWKSSYEK